MKTYSVTQDWVYLLKTHQWKKSKGYSLVKKKLKRDSNNYKNGNSNWSKQLINLIIDFKLFLCY